jgi:hypothetical protein
VNDVYLIATFVALAALPLTLFVRKIKRPAVAEVKRQSA